MPIKLPRSTDLLPGRRKPSRNALYTFDRHGDYIELDADRDTADVRLSADDMAASRDHVSLFDRLLAQHDDARRS